MVFSREGNSLLYFKDLIEVHLLWRWISEPFRVSSVGFVTTTGANPEG
jgi:hypothetical protein